MDAHIHLVVIGIDNTYHLLIAVPLGNTHQSGKPSYSEVHMHDIITRLHLLQFLQGECHLSRTGSIASQTVLMEAVEYLMIGEQTDLLVIVNESLMECLVHRHEGNGLLRHTVEDLAQTLLLLGAVGQDI